MMEKAELREGRDNVPAFTASAVLKLERKSSPVERNDGNHREL